MARFRTRWVVAAFIVVGAVLALWLIVRGLDDSSDVPEEEGTAPALTGWGGFVSADAAGPRPG